MAADNLDLQGFYTPPDNFSGLYKASDAMFRNKYREDQLSLQREGKKQATSQFLSNYLDPKSHLTGTNYDPEIVKGFDGLLQQGMQLASQGADTPSIMMALGPGVERLNQYSTKAKLIDQQIKGNVDKLKPYKGYNTDAISNEAKKMAFYDSNGQLKDINSIDPNEDWVTETVKQKPELVTTGAGLDDFVNKTPMQEDQKRVQTMYGGKKRMVSYDTKHPFWMDVSTDNNGNAVTDNTGNPKGMDVVSSVLQDDKGNPIINPDTKEPFRVMGKHEFNAVMMHNPDVADYIRGQVNSHFKQLGADKVPPENSPQYEMMARAIAYDELKARDRSSFKQSDVTTKMAPLTRIELGYGAYPTKSGAGDSNINDVFGKVKDSAKAASEGYSSGSRDNNYVDFSDLDQDAQKLVLDQAKLYSKDIDGDNIKIIYTPDGKVGLFSKDDGTRIGYMNFNSNLKVQPGVKEKREVIKEGKKQENKSGKYDNL